jgi:hypothetical protein
MKRWLAVLLTLALARPALCFRDISQLPRASKLLCELTQEAYFQLLHDPCARHNKEDILAMLLDLGRAIPPWQHAAVLPFPDVEELRKGYAPICARVSAINLALCAKRKNWRISPEFVAVWDEVCKRAKRVNEILYDQSQLSPAELEALQSNFDDYQAALAEWWNGPCEPAYGPAYQEMIASARDYEIAARSCGQRPEPADDRCAAPPWQLGRKLKPAVVRVLFLKFGKPHCQKLTGKPFVPEPPPASPFAKCAN